MNMKQSIKELKHIAIIMDGNGRWAKKRDLPRIFGHKEGVVRLKEIINYCIEQKLSYLTVFAFSSDNWKRPSDEVEFLMNLLSSELEKYLCDLDNYGVKIRFIGDCTPLPQSLVEKMKEAESITNDNHGLHLTIAINYCGQLDIVHAVNKCVQSNEKVSAELITTFLSTYPYPNPDFFIRTGGELRLSNFLLWQLAYSELYFTEVYWPDFTVDDFNAALDDYSTRERRYGKISEQL